jgi:hypothetical protein
MIKKTIVLVLILIVGVSFGSYAASGLTVYTSINSSNIVTITGDVSGSGSWVTCYVEGPDNRLEYIGNAAIESRCYEIKFEILNPVQNGEYRITIKAEGMTAPQVATFIFKTTPDITDSGSSFKYELQAVTGSQYLVSVTAQDITSFLGKNVKLTYEADKLELMDFAVQTGKHHISAGQVADTGITIISAAPGELVFTVDKDITSGKLWSGVVTVLKLKAISSGNTIISVE